MKGKVYNRRNRQALQAWLNQNGKVFTGQSSNINEINKVDDQGRTILNG